MYSLVCVLALAALPFLVAADDSHDTLTLQSVQSMTMRQEQSFTVVYTTIAIPIVVAKTLPGQPDALSVLLGALATAPGTYTFPLALPTPASPSFVPVIVSPEVGPAPTASLAQGSTTPAAEVPVVITRSGEPAFLPPTATLTPDATSPAADVLSSANAALSSQIALQSSIAAAASRADAEALASASAALSSIIFLQPTTTFPGGEPPSSVDTAVKTSTLAPTDQASTSTVNTVVQTSALVPTDTLSPAPTDLLTLFTTTTVPDVTPSESSVSSSTSAATTTAAPPAAENVAPELGFGTASLLSLPVLAAIGAYMVL